MKQSNASIRQEYLAPLILSAVIERPYCQQVSVYGKGTNETTQYILDAYDGVNW